MIIGIIIAILLVIIAFNIAFRVVVPTDEVHILQKTNTDVSYGKEQKSNVYYNIPSWVPIR
jgi:hypothetical protein